MRLLTQSALCAVFVAGLCQAALADPLAFDWSPSNVGLNGSNLTATDASIMHYADITIDTSDGVFSEYGVLAISGFQNGGAAVASVGLNSTYNLYLTFQDTGRQYGMPTAGVPAVGKFTSMSYTVWGSPAAAITVQPHSGSAPTITGQGQAIPLFFGSLLNGTISLAVNAAGISPGASADVSVVPCTAGATTTTGDACAGDEAGFFVSPAAGIAMAINNLSGAGASTLSPGTDADQDWLDIAGGTIGDISFFATQIHGVSNDSATSASEPGTVMLLAPGLLALGAMGSRRKLRLHGSH